jgi:glycosyltransferase involved in cell wall biosynthesis
MRIAQIAPLMESIPPRLYGGTERVVACLSDALVHLGHDVTLFAAADARTRATLVPVREQAIRLDPARLKSELAAHLVMLHEVKRLATGFDILHFHLDLLHFPMFEAQAEKCVTTLHGRQDVNDLSAAYALWPNFGLVSISNAQRRPLPHSNWLGTVHHGLPADLFPYDAASRGAYLAFLGRISPEKRPDRAIRLAIKAGMPLRIAAKVDNANLAYFKSVIRPLLANPLVEFLGEIGDRDKPKFLGEAAALLFPISWPEPFGLVMIEAMACGTPVIATDCGSVKEIIEDGVTGYVVRSEQDALKAIAAAPSLPRNRIRAEFERRFTATVMARGYEMIYRRMLRSQGLMRAS